MTVAYCTIERNVSSLLVFENGTTIAILRTIVPTLIARTEAFWYSIFRHLKAKLDLDPSDYFLFLEKWLGGKRFTNDEEVESAVDSCFEELNGSRYEHDIVALEHCWKNLSR